jgi:hypothetical protein
MSYVHDLQSALDRAKKAMEQAQQRQKLYADQARREGEFKVGDKVYISADGLRMQDHPSPKLAPKWLGPFPVTQVLSLVSYRLQLPDKWRCHDVFHISKLRKHKSSDKFPGRLTEPPPPVVVVEDQAYFEVDHIVKHYPKTAKSAAAATHYLIWWKGYPAWECTKEPAANIEEDTPAVIEEYWEKQAAGKAGKQQGKKATAAASSDKGKAKASQAKADPEPKSKPEPKGKGKGKGKARR